MEVGGGIVEVRGMGCGGRGEWGLEVGEGDVGVRGGGVEVGRGMEVEEGRCGG